MAGVAVAADELARVAHVLAVVAAEAAGGIEVADVVRVRLPVGLHFREEVGLVDALDFADGPFDGPFLLRVQACVVGAIELSDRALVNTARAPNIKLSSNYHSGKKWFAPPAFSVRIDRTKPPVNNSPGKG